MSHEGPCAHRPDDPDHLALVRARFGGRDTIEVVTPLIPPVGSSARTLVWWWALPLFWLWHRHERKSIRAATSALMGVRLAPLNLLVLTDQRLRLWQLTPKGRGQRRHYVVGDHLGELDRSSVLSVTNSSVGEGWRTCRLTLSDGTAMDVPVSARAVEGLVDAFPGRDVSGVETDRGLGGCGDLVVADAAPIDPMVLRRTAVAQRNTVVLVQPVPTVRAVGGRVCSMSLQSVTGDQVGKSPSIPP